MSVRADALPERDPNPPARPCGICGGDPFACACPEPCEFCGDGPCPNQCGLELGGPREDADPGPRDFADAADARHEWEV